jgi:hypothetical protein
MINLLMLRQKRRMCFSYASSCDIFYVSILCWFGEIKEFVSDVGVPIELERRKFECYLCQTQPYYMSCINWELDHGFWSVVAWLRILITGLVKLEHKYQITLRLFKIIHYLLEFKAVLGPFFLIPFLFCLMISIYHSQ